MRTNIRGKNVLKKLKKKRKEFLYSGNRCEIL